MKLASVFVARPPRPEQLRRVRRLAETYAPIDYDDGVAFAYLYFGDNFAKTYLASGILRKTGSAIRIVDLGTGSGASVCGLMARCLEMGIPVQELCVIERDAKQLEIFRAAAEPWLKETFPSLTLTIIEQDAITWLAKDTSTWDIISSSYLFCELDQVQKKRLTSLLAQQQLRGTQCVVVDSMQHEAMTLDPMHGKWRRLTVEPFEIELSFLRAVSFSERPRRATEDCQPESAAVSHGSV